jgi:hypothetical protein
MDAICVDQPSGIRPKAHRREIGDVKEAIGRKQSKQGDVPDARFSENYETSLEQSQANLVVGIRPLNFT